MVCFYVAFSIYLLAQRAGRREREIGVRCKLQEQMGTTVLHWGVPTVMHSADAFCSRRMFFNRGFENSLALSRRMGRLEFNSELGYGMCKRKFFRMQPHRTLA
jgi:hypothetical protein